MSDQAGTFWRRLDWRLWRQSYIVHVPAAERLAWVTRASPTPPAAEEPRTLAQVVDISLGGIALSASRRFDSGAVLRVEVQGGGGERPIALLARVIQVASRTGGSYLLNCCFAKELSSEELRQFGAERIRPQAADVRAWVRFPCSGEFSVHADSEKCRVKVLNVSAGGVALLSPRAFEPGALLQVELPASADQPARMVKVRVIRQTSHADNQWLLGCTFVAELTDDDVMAIT